MHAPWPEEGKPHAIAAAPTQVLQSEKGSTQTPPREEGSRRGGGKWRLILLQSCTGEEREEVTSVCEREEATLVLGPVW